MNSDVRVGSSPILGTNINNFKFNNIMTKTNKFEKIITYWKQSNNTSIYFFSIENNSICRLGIYDGDNYGIISDLYVDPKYRCINIGSQLIKECENEIRSRHIDYSKICVKRNTLETNKLLEYYKKRGYKIFELNDEYYVMLKSMI